MAIGYSNVYIPHVQSSAHYTVAVKPMGVSLLLTDWMGIGLRD